MTTKTEKMKRRELHADPKAAAKKVLAAIDQAKGKLGDAAALLGTTRSTFDRWVGVLIGYDEGFEHAVERVLRKHAEAIHETRVRTGRIGGKVGGRPRKVA